MEIFTLLKAGIRNRKGIFIGVILLTMIITTAIVSVIGVKKNAEAGYEKGHDMQQTGEVFALYRYDVFSEEFKEKVENHEWVDHVASYPCIVGSGIFNERDRKDNNTYIVTKYRDSISVFNEDLNGFVPSDQLKPLEPGEIYLPYGMRESMQIEIGETVKLPFLTDIIEEEAKDKKSETAFGHEFVLKGYVQDIYTGCSNVGSKCVFIGNEDFDRIYQECEESIRDDSDYWGVGNAVYVYASDLADPSSDKLLQRINLDLKFGDKSALLLTASSAKEYTFIMLDICMDVLGAFAIFLLVIYLIVVAHNVGTEIELDYANIGIMKSQGFSSTKIRSIYCLQYVLMEGIGVILGIGLSVCLERYLSNLFFRISAVLPENHIPVLEGILVGCGMLLTISGFVYLFTRKVIKTTPVKAIKSENSDYHYDSRFKFAISKKALDLSMGVRQITSAPARYISIVVVTALLVYAVISIQMMSEYIQSKNALRSMGVPFCEIQMVRRSDMPKGSVENIEKIVEKYTPISYREYESHFYVSVNGETILNVVEGHPEDLANVYKGRTIKYPNEILITQFVSNLLDVHIGDTVKVGYRDFDREYLVVGINQTMMDMGKAVTMSLGGINELTERTGTDDEIGMDDFNTLGIGLESSDYNDKIIEEVKDIYGDDIAIKGYSFEHSGEDDYIDDMFHLGAKASQYTINILSMVFALITVIMVCKKAFLQERLNIGIVKAVGFTTRRVRMQFAFRFMFLSLIGIILGAVMTCFWTDGMIAMIFSMFGIPHVTMQLTVASVLYPALAFAICYMIFGYLASGKVKKVSTRELIIE